MNTDTLQIAVLPTVGAKLLTCIKYDCISLSPKYAEHDVLV